MQRTKQPFRTAGRRYRTTLLAAAAIACCCGTYAIAQEAVPASAVAVTHLDDASYLSPLQIAQSAPPDTAGQAIEPAGRTVRIAGRVPCADDPDGCGPGSRAGIGVGTRGTGGTGTGTGIGSGTSGDS